MSSFFYSTMVPKKRIPGIYKKLKLSTQRQRKASFSCVTNGSLFSMVMDKLSGSFIQWWLPRQVSQHMPCLSVVLSNKQVEIRKFWARIQGVNSTHMKKIDVQTDFPVHSFSYMGLNIEY